MNPTSSGHRPFAALPAAAAVFCPSLPQTLSTFTPSTRPARPVPPPPCRYSIHLYTQHKHPVGGTMSRSITQDKCFEATRPSFARKTCVFQLIIAQPVKNNYADNFCVYSVEELWHTHTHTHTSFKLSGRPRLDVIDQHHDNVAIIPRR